MAEKKEEGEDPSDVTEEEIIPMDCKEKDPDWSPPPPSGQGDWYLLSV